MELRNARHTNDLKSLVEFYTNIIGLEVLFSFENHNGYTGVMIGKPNQDWHLEFTVSEDEADHKFDADDVLVFYPTELSKYEAIIDMIEKNNIKKIKAKNPYWDDNGVMIADPDGFGVIVSNLRIK